MIMSRLYGTTDRLLRLILHWWQNQRSLSLGQRRVTALRQMDMGKLGKGAREAVFARYPMVRAEAAQAPQRLIRLQPVDQDFRGRQIERGLGHKARASATRSRAGRPTPRSSGTNRSIFIISNTVATCLSGGVISPSRSFRNGNSPSCT